MFYFRSQKIKSLVSVLVLLSITGALFFGVFGFAKPAQAGMGGWVSAIVTAAGIAAAAYGVSEGIDAIKNLAANFDIICIGLLSGLAKFIGIIFTWVVGMLIQVAAYNDFLNATAVTTGWGIVRDVCNMFFVLILLVISIATILRVESYSYKKLLPKLLLMAVLINFSKTICGIIIDFGQVVMLTFVNAFKAAAGANFWQAMGINKLFSFEDLVAKAKASTETDWNLVGTALLGFIIVLVATVTVGVLMVVLVLRIVVLWTLIVLSPLAYLLGSFPQGQQYAKQWWDEFSKNVITGPVLAFFIWLSLIVAGGGNASTQVGTSFAPADLPAGFGDIANPNFLSSFVVSVALLLVGLMFTQKSGVIGAGVAGSALNGLRRAGTAPWRAVRKTGSLAWRGAKAVGKGGYNRGADMLYGATGVALPLSERRKEGKDKRRAKIRQMRTAQGMAKTAERKAKGRSFLASIVDPRAAENLTMTENLGAAFGVKSAQEKVRRGASSLASSAGDEMRSVDRLQGERLQERTEGRIAEKQLRQAQKNPEFKSVMATRDGELAAAITAQQSEVTLRQSEADTLAQAAKFHKLLDPATTDDDIRDVVSEDRAQADLKTEKERRKRLGLSEMSKAEERVFLTPKRAAYRGAVVPANERTSMAAALTALGLGAAAPSDEMVDAAQKALKEAKGTLEAATHSLESFRDRDRNPKAARADALSRREAARERGDDDEVRKINFELSDLEPTIKIKDVQNFFKMSYKEQLNVAQKSAEGLSESKLAKDIAAALNGGEISRTDRNEIMKLWADKDFHAARERFDEILKKARAAKTP